MFSDKGWSKRQWILPWSWTTSPSTMSTVEMERCILHSSSFHCCWDSTSCNILVKTEGSDSDFVSVDSPTSKSLDSPLSSPTFPSLSSPRPPRLVLHLLGQLRRPPQKPRAISTQYLLHLGSTFICEYLPIAFRSRQLPSTMLTSKLIVGLLL